jgi:hypothetical protein
MTRGLCHFRKSDLSRAVRALKDAGVKIDRVEICADGKLAVIVDRNGKEDGETTPNPWDRVFENAKET